MKKRASVLTCLLLAAVLTVSATACSGNSSTESSSPSASSSSTMKGDKETESKADESKGDGTEEESRKTEASEDSKAAEESSGSAASKEETSSKAETSDVSKEEESSSGEASGSSSATELDVEKAISDRIDLSKVGPLTKKAAEKTSAANLTIAISGEAADSLGAVSLRLQKNDKGYSRIEMNMGIMNIDALTTPDASYIINHDTKKYAQTDAEEAMDMADEMLPGASSVTDSDTKENVTYLGQTTETVGSVAYTVESYKIVTPESIGYDGEKKPASESSLKMYFAGEDLKIISVDAEGTTSTFTVDEFKTEVAADAFDLPTGYTKVDNSYEVYLDLSDLSLPSDFSFPEDISLP